MMKMLDVAGVPVFADNQSAYESDLLSMDRNMAKMLPRLWGKAAKVLDPHRPDCFADWPNPCDARVIWMDRNHIQQAKSQIKFMRLVGGFQIPSQAWRRVADSLYPDTALCLKEMAARGVSIERVTFEGLLQYPLETSIRIADFLGMSLDVDRMAAAVIDRPVKCAPDLAIEHAAMMADAPSGTGGKE
jgi:hypothetical protein